jgi:hypothetical protein
MGERDERADAVTEGVALRNAVLLPLALSLAVTLPLALPLPHGDALEVAEKPLALASPLDERECLTEIETEGLPDKLEENDAEREGSEEPLIEPLALVSPLGERENQTESESKGLPDAVAEGAPDLERSAEPLLVGTPVGECVAKGELEACPAVDV